MEEESTRRSDADSDGAVLASDVVSENHVVSENGGASDGAQVDDRAPDDRAPDDRVSDDQPSGEQVSGEQVSDDQVSDDPVSGDQPSGDGFSVSLSNFSGPFDLLLTLISKHEMDITEVSLSKVTDEFISYLRGLDSEKELDQASEFLVVAATLLDLKVAGLLPQGELVDAEDVALLEARDLLFARLLQYRAFKEAAQWFAAGLEVESTRHFRSVRLEEKYRRQTPELVWTLTVDDFAALAALAFAPRELPSVGLDHLHAPLVSIREQAAHVVALLRRGEPMSFRQLIAGADQKGVIIARFLAVLELYRGGNISYDQLEPLGELTLHWTAEHWNDDSLANLGADYDA